jgi:hypothetical protein
MKKEMKQLLLINRSIEIERVLRMYWKKRRRKRKRNNIDYKFNYFYQLSMFENTNAPVKYVASVPKIVDPEPITCIIEPSNTSH